MREEDVLDDAVAESGNEESVCYTLQRFEGQMGVYLDLAEVLVEEVWVYVHEKVGGELSTGLAGSYVEGYGLGYEGKGRERVWMLRLIEGNVDRAEVGRYVVFAR